MFPLFILKVLLILLVIGLSPLAIVIVGIFLPYIILENVAYRKAKKVLNVILCFFFGIVLLPLWILIEIIPGSCLLVTHLYKEGFI